MAIKELSNVQIKSGSSWYKLCPFPVGYIYLGYIDSSPAGTYGGTWSRLTDNYYLRVNSTSSTRSGGSSIIKTENMPSHTHKFTHYAWARPYGTTNWDVTNAFATANLTGATDLTNPQSVSYVGGGASVLSKLSKCLCLEKNSLTSISWMEVSDNDNNTR